jgi:small-conductance mechanosensitive channel
MNKEKGDVDKETSVANNISPNTNTSRKRVKDIALKKIIILGIILAITLTISTAFLKPVIPFQDLMYLQTIQVAVIGYFVIETISSITYKLAVSDNSQEMAKALRSIIRISGVIILVAIIISYLAQNPVLAASISTISALVVGFASQNILGNMIAGFYLSIIRPFKIGDKISVSGNAGVIHDIELIYTRLLSENGDIVLVPSSSMVTSTVVLQRGRRDEAK